MAQQSISHPLTLSHTLSLRTHLTPNPYLQKPEHEHRHANRGGAMCMGGVRLTNHSHSLTLSLPHSLIYPTLSLSHSCTRSRSHSHSLTHSLSHCLTLSLSYSLTLARAHALTLTLSLSHAFTLSLSLSHAGTPSRGSREMASSPCPRSQP